MTSRNQSNNGRRYHIKITEFPQIVAAFNYLVGLAAVNMSIASFMSTADPPHLHAVLNISTYICTFLGAVSLGGFLSYIIFHAMSRSLRNVILD